MRKFSGIIVAVSLLASARATVALACDNPDTLGTSREIAVGGAIEIGLKTYPRTLALADHEVVLTFDDGPEPGSTPHVLDALEAQCVKATFFIIGRKAATAPALVKREIADGFTVGHHTFTHPAVTMRGLSDAAARADIEAGFKADDTAAYGTDAGAPRVPFFRFPGFADTPALLTYLKARNVAVFGTDLWASDWVDMSPEKELRLLMSRLDRAGRGVILLHDARRQTAEMLPRFLDALKRGGYRIVHLVPGKAAPPLREAPAGWTSETEAIVARLMPKLQARAPASRAEKAAKPVEPAKILRPSEAPADPAPLPEPDPPALDQP